MINIPPIWVAFILGPTLGPIITSLLTHYQADNRLKIVVNAVVSVVVGVVASSIIPETGEAVFSWGTLASAFITFVTSTTFYDSVYKKVLNLNERPAVLPTKGLGAPKPARGLETP